MLRILHDTNYRLHRLVEDRPPVVTIALHPARRSSSIAVAALQLQHRVHRRHADAAAASTSRPIAAEMRATLDAAGITRRGDHAVRRRHRRTSCARRIRGRSREQARGAESWPTALTRRCAQDVRRRHVQGACAPRPWARRWAANSRRGAFIAILLSLRRTLGYLAWRFEWRFGLAAVIATAHDILATIAFIKSCTSRCRSWSSPPS